MGSVPPSGCRRSRFFSREIKWLRRLFFALFSLPRRVSVRGKRMFRALPRARRRKVCVGGEKTLDNAWRYLIKYETGEVGEFIRHSG